MSPRTPVPGHLTSHTNPGPAWEPCALIRAGGLSASLLAAPGSPSGKSRGGGRAWKLWISTRDEPGAAVCSHSTASSRAKQPDQVLPISKTLVLWKEPGLAQPASASPPHCLKPQGGFITSRGVRAPGGTPSLSQPPRISSCLILSGARDSWRKVFPPALACLWALIPS